MDQDVALAFLQENWIPVLMAIIAILIALKVFKAIIKWTLIAVLILGIVLYGGFKMKDQSSGGMTFTNHLQDRVIQYLSSNAAEDQNYNRFTDGSYSIKTKHLEINGAENKDTVSVKIYGVSMGEWELKGEVRELVLRSRTENGK